MGFEGGNREGFVTFILMAITVTFDLIKFILALCFLGYSMYKQNPVIPAER
jgi:hypothetical protein